MVYANRIENKENLHKLEKFKEFEARILKNKSKLCVDVGEVQPGQ